MFAYKITAIALPAGVRHWQGITAQHLENSRRPGADALTELTGFKGRGDDLIDDHRRLGIGEAVFQAVADFNTQFAVIAGNDQ